MTQENKTISISKLKLWTENPRDPFDINEQNELGDLGIIKKALNQSECKWELKKLAKNMGEHYDLSEIPTVVANGNNYVVYDGNRRLAIIKYLQNPEWEKGIKEKIILKNPDKFKKMLEISCNVCDKDTALTNIERKHMNSGSWKPLAREYFKKNHKNQRASNFLIIEEQTQIISKNFEIMDKVFVKNEIFTKDNLNKIGFDIKNEKFISNYEDEKAKDIIKKIIILIQEKGISTRKNRRKLKKALIEKFPNLELKEFNEKEKQDLVSPLCKKIKLTKKTNKTKFFPIFGEKLSLKQGITNDIYLDILNLYKFYWEKKDKLSEHFPALIRASLRLLIESTRENEKIKYYLKQYISDERFQKAKKKLNEDKKFTLYSKIENRNKLISFLQKGAHQYSVLTSIEDLLAISLIIGKMLMETHSKKNK